VFLGRYAVNPVNGEQIPVWAADYVLPDYGTGAIMAVPAHDQRDLDFARKFGLPVQVVVDTGGRTGGDRPGHAGEGTLVNSGPLDGLSKAEAIATITQILAGRGWARPRSTTGCATGWSPGSGSGARRSRSCTARAAARFRCPRGPAGRLPGPARAGSGAQGRLAAGRGHRVGEHHLPEVRRPGQAGHRHDGHVRRLVLVLPALLLAGYTEGAFEVESVRRWSPVDLYVGGVEHAILHLLYSRFFVKVLYDMRMVDFVEPFTALMNQGQVINRGRRCRSRWATALTWASSWPRTVSTRSG
jgi:leucyl-tRNA synthetase